MKIFVTKSGLAQHALTDHGKVIDTKNIPNGYRCTKCKDKTFSAKASLELHITSKHTKNNVDENQNLTKEDDTETQEMRDGYHCVVCENLYTVKYSLMKHYLKEHDMVVPQRDIPNGYRCKLCENRAFDTKTQLELHMTKKHAKNKI